MYCFNNTEHTVMQGDTFFSIAQMYHTDVNNVLALNPSVDPNNLRVGSVIRVCAGGVGHEVANENIGNAVHSTVPPAPPQRIPPATTPPAGVPIAPPMTTPAAPPIATIPIAPPVTVVTPPTAPITQPSVPPVSRPATQPPSARPTQPPSARTTEETHRQNRTEHNRTEHNRTHTHTEERAIGRTAGEILGGIASGVIRGATQQRQVSQATQPQMTQPQMTQPQISSAQMQVPQMPQTNENFEITSSVEMTNINDFEPDFECSNQTSLIQQMRLVWSQHVYWTRMLLVDLAARLPSANDTQNRVLQNPADIAAVLEGYFTREEVERIETLLTEHLKIGAAIIIASRDGNTEQADTLTCQWYINASELADAFADLLGLDRDELQEMFFTHLDLTTDEVTAHLSGDFQGGIDAFDKVESEAMNMADMFSRGIILLFPDMF